MFNSPNGTAQNRFRFVSNLGIEFVFIDTHFSTEQKVALLRTETYRGGKKSYCESRKRFTAEKNRIVKVGNVSRREKIALQRTEIVSRWTEMALQWEKMASRRKKSTRGGCNPIFSCFE